LIFSINLHLPNVDVRFIDGKASVTPQASSPSRDLVAEMMVMAGRTMAQIMAVTGHKSASSVAVYQRVSSKEKQVMGDIITSSARGEQPSQERYILIFY
jgi:exoribonuclease R